MIKATVSTKPQEPKISYPWIGVSPRGRVVLFFAASKGTVLADPTGYEGAGYISEDWGMEIFTPLRGSITLSNEVA